MTNKRKVIRAWAVQINGRFEWDEPNLDYGEKSLILYFSRRRAFDENGEWNGAWKRKNRKCILNKGVKIVPVEISPIKPLKRNPW